ncbi:hypothetical protein HHI36_008567 [Cryptolaemus montrouzieri]|uniref:DDE-1 domain-containing protein n=1 Tax=Cryptolaemus montrouzieri TaxID=559131 RepID=A0ABD2MTR4_9CUCU
MTTVQNPGKILATKGQKRVGSITSWERGKNITLMFVMNAAGGFIPPMFIYPRKKMTPLLEKDGPSGALYKCSDNGWINESLFLEWLAHFKKHAKPSMDEPVLLISDNHASHSSLPVYEFCKSNYIHMLSLLPHTSHRMQPLDVSFFGPLKTAYKKECDLYMKSNRLEHITPCDVASLVRKSYITVASINKAESGFRATGIFPINPQVFSEEDFMAAEILQSHSIVVCNESITISTCDIEQDSNVIPSTSKQLDLSAVSESEQIVISSPTSKAKEPSDPPSNVQLSDFIKLSKKTLKLKRNSAERSSMLLY